MSFVDDLKDFGKDVVSGTATTLGGSLGGAAANAVLGYGEPDYADEAQTGANIDMRTFKRQHKFKYKFGRRKGLNAFELLGDGSGMGGAPSTAATGVLGNQAGAAALQREQLNQQIGLELAKTKMQTDAQRDVAEIGAGASRYGTDVKAQIDQQKVDLASREFQEIALKESAKNLRLKEEQIQKAIHEVVTSEPKFVLRKILLNMGTENSIQTLVLNRRKVDITDPKSVQNLSQDEYNALYTALLGAQSHVQKEVHGVKDLMDHLMSYIKSDYDRRGRSGSSGGPKGPTSSEPFQYGPNMNYR